MRTPCARHAHVTHTSRICTGATMTRTLSRQPSTGAECASPGLLSSAGAHGFQSLSIHAVHGEAGSAAGDGADGAAGSSTSEPTTPRSTGSGAG